MTSRHAIDIPRHLLDAPLYAVEAELSPWESWPPVEPGYVREQRWRVRRGDRIVYAVTDVRGQRGEVGEELEDG